MNITRSGRVLAIAAAVSVSALVLSGCAANEAPVEPTATPLNISGKLTGAGASSQAAAEDAWIADFQMTNNLVDVTYDPTGSGAGRTAFISGGVSFAGTDSYLSDKELASTFAACTPGTKVFEVPVYVSPIAVIYNVDGVTDLNLDAATIAKIFTGAITTWNDPAIVALNPKAKLPATAITPVHRSDDSGTSKNFSDYLFQNAKADWAIEKPADKFPFEVGEAAQGTAGVVAAVANGTGTIGYADASKVGKLTVANIKVGKEFVAYSPEGAAAVVAGSTAVAGRDKNDMAVDINRTTTDPKEYPLVLVSYAVGCTSYADAKVGPLVNAYISYLVSEQGQALAAKAAGSAPLSPEVQKQAAAIAATIK